MPLVSTKPLVPVDTDTFERKSMSIFGEAALAPSWAVRERAADGRLAGCGDSSKEQRFVGRTSVSDSSGQGSRQAFQVNDSSGRGLAGALVFVLLENPRVPCVVFRTDSTGQLELDFKKPGRNYDVEVWAESYRIEVLRLSGASERLNDARHIVALGSS